MAHKNTDAFSVVDITAMAIDITSSARHEWVRRIFFDEKFSRVCETKTT